jgi:LmbE family N-acetylglucosaminyl deacetylase
VNTNPTKPGASSWLVLGDDGGSRPQAGSVPDLPQGEPDYGTLDDYPDHPGGRDGILVRLSPEFGRWYRWHVRDLSRQLKAGGILELSGTPFREPTTLGPGGRAKRFLRERLWLLAAWCGRPRFQRRLLPSPLLAAAREAGLELVSPDGIAANPDARTARICFRKSRQDQAAPCNPSVLGRQFRMHFAEWLHGGQDPATWPTVPVADAADLLADRGTSPAVLVLSPHPDDELIGCGGTLLALATAGARIHVVQMTEGMTCLALRGVDDHVRRSIRWREAAIVARRFGFSPHYWETGESRGLDNNAATRDRLRVLLKELKPALVFVPAAGDQHPEHRLAYQIFQQSRDALPSTARVLDYPVWGFLPEPSLAVDVTARYPEVLDALFSYKTAMKAEDYVTRCRVLAAYHGSRLLGNPDLSCEVFHDINAAVPG